MRAISISSMAMRTSSSSKSIVISLELSEAPKYYIIQQYAPHKQLLLKHTQYLIFGSSDPLPLYYCSKSSSESPSIHYSETGSGGSLFTNFWVPLIATAITILCENEKYNRQQRAHFTITHQQQQQQQYCIIVHTGPCVLVDSLTVSIVTYYSFSSVQFSVRGDSETAVISQRSQNTTPHRVYRTHDDNGGNDDDDND